MHESWKSAVRIGTGMAILFWSLTATIAEAADLVRTPPEYSRGKEGTLRPVDEDIFYGEQRISLMLPEEKELDDRLLQPPERPYPFPKATIERVNGALRFAVGGKPLMNSMRSCDMRILDGMPVERQMRLSGMTLFMVDLLPAARMEQYDAVAGAMLEKSMGRLMQAAPDAYVIIRFWTIEAMSDFPEMYPDNVFESYDGKRDTKARRGWGGYDTTLKPSPLNAWRRYAGEQLRRLVDLAGRSRYADRIIGFYVGALNTGEWSLYGPGTSIGKEALPFDWDYCPARKDIFKRFVHLKYGGNAKQIAAAWGGDSELSLPTPAERNRLPVLPGKTSDYNQTLSLPILDAAEYFGRIVKAATNGNALYGAEIRTAWNCAARYNGYVFCRYLIESPYVDFFGGPATYDLREPGNSSFHMTSDGTLNLHNKFFLNEADLRTHRAPLSHLGNPPLTPEELVEVVKRELLRGCLKQCPTYLMDFGYNWYYDRSLFRILRDLTVLDAEMQRGGLPRSADVAIVSDQESQLYFEWGSSPLMMLKYVMEHVGTEYDYYELRDFLREDVLRKYKFVIFMNLAALSDREIAQLQRVKGDGRTLLWMKDPGLVNLSRDGADYAHTLRDLTGMDLDPVNPRARVREPITLVPAKFQGLFGRAPKDLALYSGPLIKEVAYPLDIRCADKEAVRLAETASGACYFAAKKLEGWTSIYCAAPALSPEIVRAMAVAAGCHVYVEDDDIAFAAGDYIAVHAASSGVRTVRFKRPCTAYELFSGKQVARNARSATFEMRTGCTYLLYAGNDASILDRMDAARREQDRLADAYKAQYPAPSVDRQVAQFWSVQRPKGDGPFLLKDQCAQAFLYSGPYGVSADALTRLDQLAEAASARGVLSKMPDEPPVNLARYSLSGDDFMRILQPLPCLSIEQGLGPWQSGAEPEVGVPWIDDYALGFADNQSYLVAYCLNSATDRNDVEIAFRCSGDGAAWLNGHPLSGQPGVLGTCVTLPKGRSLLVLRIASTGGPSGFTCRFMAPGQTVGRDNRRLWKQAENLTFTVGE